VDSARGKALADEYHMKFFEASAKDGTNVREAFYTVARDVVVKMLAGEAAVEGAAGGGAAGGKGGGKGGKDEKCCIQ
jgi:hypothetical protein